jgi:hypothetical protein
VSEVDGSPSGSRFGGGRSRSRTETQPARCILSWTGELPAKFHRQSECRNLRQVPRHRCLTAVGGSSRFAPAPSTERPRLMASRPAPAPAEVGRKTGRRRHRLGVLRGGTPGSSRSPLLRFRKKGVRGGNMVSPAIGFPREPPPSPRSLRTPRLASRPAKPAFGRKRAAHCSCGQQGAWLQGSRLLLEAGE